MKLMNRRAFALMSALALDAGSAQAATITWTGTVDANWSTAGNWAGVHTPPVVTNDSLVFGATAGATALNNDLVFTNCGGITFNSDAPAYTLGGLPVANGGSIGGFTVNSAGNLAQIINNDFTTLPQNAFNVAGPGNLTLGGAFSKSGTWNPNLTMVGTGTLTLNGATGFSASYLTVNSGTVVLAKAGVGLVASAITLNGGTMMLGSSNQVVSSLAMTAGATFDLNGYDDGSMIAPNQSGFTLMNGPGGLIVNNVTGAGTNTLVIGGGNVPGTYGTFGGRIMDGPSAKTALGLTMNCWNNVYQILTGNNTYSGGTRFGPMSQTSTFNGGSTLSIASMQNIGAAGSRNLTFSGPASFVAHSVLQITGTAITDSSAFDSITFNTGTRAGFDIADPSNTFTLSQAVSSGTGGTFLKKGAGTLVLTGAATYTGATSLNGGTLKVDYQAGGSLNSATAPLFSGGDLFLLGMNSGTTTQTLGNVTVNAGGGKLLIDPNGGTSTTLTLGSLTATAAGGSLVLGKALNAGTGTVVITTTSNKGAQGIYGGRVIIADGTASTGYDFATTASGGSPYTLSAYTNASELPTSGGSGTTNYKMTNATTLFGHVAVNSLKLEAPSGDLALAGNTLTITNGGLLSTGTGATQITGDAGVTGLTAGNGSGTYDLIVHQYNSGGLTIGAVIGNNGVNAVNLVKAGSGTLTLGGINTYTGATYVIGGKLAITDNNQLGAVATGAALTLNGGTLASTGTFALDNAGANKRAISIGGSGGGFEVGPGVLTVSGAVNALGMLTKSGAGVLLLSAANTLLGGVTIHDGTLRLGAANALQNGAGTASSSLILGSSSTPTLQLYNYDASVLSLVSVNTAAVVENGGATNKTITVNNGADNTFAGVLRNGAAGTLALAKTGAGTLTLSGANTYSGATTISAGTLALSGLLTNTAITVASGATFTQSESGVIAGSASLTNNGTTTLFGANTYTGGTTIANGILTLGASGVLADNGAVAINGTGATFAVNGQTETIGRLTGTGGTLDVGVNGALTVNYGNVNSTLASAIVGSGTLAIVGTGGKYGNAYALTGNNSAFSGKIWITNGILRADNDTALGAVPGSFTADALAFYGQAAFSTVNASNLTISAHRGIVITNGQTIFAGGANLIINSVVSGNAGALIRSASANAVTFAGTNTYSGGTQIYTDNGNNSTLRLGANDALPHGAGKGALAIDAWSTGIAKFDLNGYSQTVNGLTSGGTTSPTNSIIDNTGSAASTLTAGDNNAAGSFGGIIRSTTGILSLTKIGTNTLTLSGPNTYTGGTAVNGGTLKLGSAGAVAASTSIVVQTTLDVSSVAWTLGSGQVLSGTGTLVGVSTVAGAVSPGSGGIGTLTASNVTWNAGVAWPFDIGAASASDRLRINGTFTGSGSGFAFDLQNTGVAGVYTLVTWSVSTAFVAGDFAANNVPGGLTPTFAVNANELTLTLAGGGAPILVVAPASLDFGGVEVGSSSSLVFVVTNTGTALLTGNAAAGLSQYSIVGDTNFIVAAGGSSNITISFMPSLAESYPANVTFLSDGGGSTNAASGYGFIIAGSTNVSIARSGGDVQMGFGLVSGALYRVEATTDLQDGTGWTNLTELLTNRTGSVLPFTDTNAAAYPMRAYRIRSP